MEKIKKLLSDSELEYVVFKRVCKECKEIKNIEEYDEISRGKNTYHRRVCHICFNTTKKKYNADYYKRKKEKFKKENMLNDSEDILTDSDISKYTL